MNLLFYFQRSEILRIILIYIEQAWFKNITNMYWLILAIVYFIQTLAVIVALFKVKLEYKWYIISVSMFSGLHLLALHLDNVILQALTLNTIFSLNILLAIYKIFADCLDGDAYSKQYGPSIVLTFSFIKISLILTHLNILYGNVDVFMLNCAVLQILFSFATLFTLFNRCVYSHRYKYLIYSVYILCRILTSGILIPLFWIFVNPYNIIFSVSYITLYFTIYHSIV